MLWCNFSVMLYIAGQKYIAADSTKNISLSKYTFNSLSWNSFLWNLSIVIIDKQSLYINYKLLSQCLRVTLSTNISFNSKLTYYIQLDSEWKEEFWYKFFKNTLRNKFQFLIQNICFGFILDLYFLFYHKIKPNSFTYANHC